MPRVGPHEFHVLVAGAKLQEHPHLGKMWVVMPSGIGEACCSDEAYPCPSPPSSKDAAS